MISSFPPIAGAVTIALAFLTAQVSPVDAAFFSLTAGVTFVVVVGLDYFRRRRGRR